MAVKLNFAEHAGVVAVLGLTRTAEASIDTRADSALVTVVNQDVPIEPELIPKLFEPMTRGESPDQGHRSVGLGLFIVSEIARAHSGRVIVESSSQLGTRFSVLLSQVSNDRN